MPFVPFTRYLTFCVIALTASTATAQTAQPKLEVLGRQGAYYWVVETAQDGSRTGGWVNAEALDSIVSRGNLNSIPRQPASTAAVMPTLDSVVIALEQVRSRIGNAANAVQGLPDAGVLNQRSARINDAIVILQSLATDDSAAPAAVAPREPTAMRSTPVRQGSEPSPPRQQPSTPTQRHPQTREGFWFNAGMGLGFAGCQGCVGTNAGASGGLSLGGTLNEKWLLGVGTSGWYKSYADGSTLSGGTTDARVRFYPSLNSGFFITGGLGLGHVTVGLGNFGSVSETGVGALFGVGWDIRIRPNVSLTPFYNGFAVQTSNADGHVDQFGLGVTVH